jgi:hypothetical protein
MQDNKQFDILACLKDIEQSIIEIYEFLPEERNFFAFKKDVIWLIVNRYLPILEKEVGRLLNNMTS